MAGNNIRVVCRFRPQNRMELENAGQPVVQIGEDGMAISLDVRPARLALSCPVPRWPSDSPEHACAGPTYPRTVL